MLPVVYDHHSKFQWKLPSQVPLEEADTLFMWNDFLFSSIVNEARSKGKKVVLFQHGRFAFEDYGLHGDVMIADGAISWGLEGKEMLMRSGVDEERILVAGHPWFRPEGDAALYDPNGPIYFIASHWAEGGVEAVRGLNDYYIDLIVDHADGREVVIKAMEKTTFSPRTDVSVFNTSLEDKFSNEATLAYLIENPASMFITLRESTFEMYARANGIPVIHVNSELANYKQRDRLVPEVYRCYQTRVDVSELSMAMEWALPAPPEYFEHEVSGGIVQEEELSKFVGGL